MSKDTASLQNLASPAVQEKIQELAALVAAEAFGPDGIPKEIKFAIIEAIGHEAGQMVATKIDQVLMEDHQRHFAAAQPCPQCGHACGGMASQRELKTRDGTVTLPEMACYCPVCRRSFFPSASSARS